MSKKPISQLLKVHSNLLILLLSIALFGCETVIQPDKYTQQHTLIKNVYIIDVANRTLSELSQLEVQGGKITAIYPADKPHTTHYAHIIDAKGGYVSPGLIDMHVHAYDPAAFALSLAHGVTHVRVMHGIKEHINWRDEIAAGQRVGSTITVSSPIISGFEHGAFHHLVHTPEEARREVKAAKQAGYDLIKAYGNLSAPVLEALIDEAGNQSIAVAKHGPHPSKGMTWNKLAGLQSMEHVEDIYQGLLSHTQDEAKLSQAVQSLKQLNVPVTPTLNIYWQLTELSTHKQDFLDSQPSGYISPVVTMLAKHDQVNRWLNSSDKMAAHNRKTLAFLQHITARLDAAGIELLVGSDAGVLMSPHGLATLTEMRLMQESGIKPVDVVRAATMNSAKALGISEHYGQVKTGFAADLVVTVQNPIESVVAYDNPLFVLKQGGVYSAGDLAQLKQDAIEGRSIWQELIILLREW
ncbi:amidohydrolase family protein [Pseudoalteromonas rubra]|uniref:Amidohydrolase-related domain-containing protein n=1 Tax=Pseudoalteromonas rubra TaxID=43658 RepID=A0A0U3GNJ8_9GAMM|nr:amidohydrolase family protein [Pseudoalteromonas rubra]ALU44587.1 hypothetical protein AT705_17585 [Pseudoalteromonas rubra]